MLFASLETVTLPTQASEFAVWYDRAFWYVTLVITVGGLGVFAALAYFCFRFAHWNSKRSLRILGSDKIELIWTVIPLVFFLSFFVMGIPLYLYVTKVPADAPEVFVVGKQWMWKLQHANTGVREINELHIPVGRPVKLTLTSEDVLHDFGVPAFRNKIDVVPGRMVTTWYHPTETGVFWIFCDQYCGQGHSQMVGKVHVMSAEDYEAWLEGRRTDTPGAPADRPTDGSPAWEGQKLFLKLQCITCHNNAYDADPSNTNTSNRAPNLEGLFESQVPLESGKTVTADHQYIYESIRNPQAKVHQGWKPIMPAFGRSQVTEEEMMSLVAYIKYLKHGKLPRRTDRTAAPVGAPVAPDSEGNRPQAPALAPAPNTPKNGGK
jgi:cytochrome c oxidase subunit 2